MAQRESREQVRELEKLVKSLLRQNESINSELSKTKSKFLEYSNTITTLKEEVSWKITKYLEETADSHTQMKITSEEVKLQNFNMNLQIEKQKQKYDDIILKYEEDLVFRSDAQQSIHSLSAQADQNHAATSSLSIKTDDLELALLSKIKNIDLRFEDKMQEMDKNSTKLTGAFRKIDNFN